MTSPPHGAPFDREGLYARVDRETRRLEMNVWTSSDAESTIATFERAAAQALRVPVLAERSVHLRRVAKMLLPRALRPAVRRLASRFDETSRTLATHFARRGGER